MIKGELGRKLFLMIKGAFDGQEPVVYDTDYDGGFTFVIGENSPRIPSRLQPAGVIDHTDWFSGEKFHADMSTDDWPFFYMPVRKYPVSYLIIIVVLLVVSVLFVRPLVGGQSGGGTEGGARGFSAPCFILGAGFMLLETKAVTELALFYGSTWVVTGIVITAILVLAFLANLLLMAVDRIPTVAVYVLLLASLGASIYWSGMAASYGVWSARLR